jgi:maltooligosyltrehalose trehalohydrolase
LHSRAANVVTFANLPTGLHNMLTIPVKVWAPTAQSVWLHAHAEKISLRSDGAGWWTSDRISWDANDEYMLSVNDGPPRPDPRSAWQPHGVHGSSRIVDHTTFQWSDRGFQARPLSSAIIYELHIGTFSEAGTFDGAIAHLDHLLDLGITHVELMPVVEFPGKFGWGYDGVCLFAPASFYGGPDGLKRLVDACHQRGLAVILDVVYNHLGPVGNYLSEFGPYFSENHHTPWGRAINFDGPHSDGVRRFFCDNALMWLEHYHFDALRLDAVHAILDTTAFPFLEQLALEVEQLGAYTGRHLALIAESDLNDPRLSRAHEAGGFGLDAQWCDDFHHALHTVISGERNGYYEDFGSLETLAHAFEHPYVYTGQASHFRRRSHGRMAHELSAHRFVTYTQNHDQIGNRAKGDRLAHGVSLNRAKVAAALLFASPYIPQIFQGEEWNSTSPFFYFADWSEVPELASAVLKGRREEFAQFGWQPEDLLDPTLSTTLDQSKLHWDELSQENHAQMFAWYQRLIALRREWRELTDGRLQKVWTDYDEQQRWLMIRRDTILIIVNLADTCREVRLPQDVGWHTVLSSIDSSEGCTLAVTSEHIRMPSESIAFLTPAI